MPLQNRVTPAGDLVAVPARGTLMGNRGCLHDAAQRIVRRVVAGRRAWVSCVLAFRGRRRALMTPGRYTELFFLDEATALAAGHRPCGECRRADLRRFQAAWYRGNGTGGPVAPAVDALDRALHRDRVGADAGPRTFSGVLADLPDGVFVRCAGEATPLLWWGGRLWPWHPEGYGPPREAALGDVAVLTPRSTVRTLAAGYRPGIHPSLQSWSCIDTSRALPYHRVPEPGR